MPTAGILQVVFQIGQDVNLFSKRIKEIQVIFIWDNITGTPIRLVFL
jgi:hypothetical protein